MSVLIDNRCDNNNIEHLDNLLTNTVKQVLKLEQQDADMQVSVLIVNDEQIRSMNNEFRSVDKATDVLSFPMLEYYDDDDLIDYNLAMETDPETGETLLGDIVISYETAVRQAVEYGHSLDRELSFLAVHGMLHLLGYDHMADEELKLMQKREKEILEVLDKPRDNKYELLIDKAVKAKDMSYSPYSNFRVGACVLTDNGNMYTGCNIESNTYTPTVCAERVAMFKAVSEGDVNIKAIAVTSDRDDYIMPCGVCRQVIAELAPSADILCTKPDGTYKLLRLPDLLPDAFKL